MRLFSAARVNARAQRSCSVRVCSDTAEKVPFNPLTPAAFFFLQSQFNLDILCKKGKEKVCILPNIEKSFFLGYY